MAVYINKLTGNTIETECNIEGENWEEIEDVNTIEEIEDVNTIEEIEDVNTIEEIEDADIVEEQPKKNGKKNK